MWGDGTIQCHVVLLVSMPGRPVSLDNGRAIVWIMVGQGHTVLAVGAGGGSSDIFFSAACHFSFPPPSVWVGWMDDLILRPFQQNLSYIRTMGG